MVTAKAQYSLANAREYFEDHLCVGDYYDEGQRVSDEWQGLGVERLGLVGRVRAEDLLRLCENQHPATGQRLTQRLNTTRADGDGSAANRRIFYDFTFSPPKSVSLAGYLSEDTRVLDAHARAVKSALRKLEAFFTKKPTLCRQPSRTLALHLLPIHRRKIEHFLPFEYQFLTCFAGCSTSR